MENNKFIELCKAEVVKYHNYHQDPVICIDESHVFVVWQCKTLQNHKALLGVMKPDGGMYYEITYNGDRGEMYVDAYKKEKNICVELNEPQAELGRTVRMMLSPDYKERFRAEYTQLLIRRAKLEDMLEKMADGTLDFTPTCPFELLKEQLDIMSEYLSILEARAKLERVTV
jgi:hypothetical protein